MGRGKKTASGLENCRGRKQGSTGALGRRVPREGGEGPLLTTEWPSRGHGEEFQALGKVRGEDRRVGVVRSLLGKTAGEEGGPFLRWTYTGMTGIMTLVLVYARQMVTVPPCVLKGRGAWKTWI